MNLILSGGFVNSAPYYFKSWTDFSNCFHPLFWVAASQQMIQLTTLIDSCTTDCGLSACIGSMINHLCFASVSSSLHQGVVSLTTVSLLRRSACLFLFCPPPPVKQLNRKLWASTKSSLPPYIEESITDGCSSFMKTACGSAASKSNNSCRLSRTYFATKRLSRVTVTAT